MRVVGSDMALAMLPIYAGSSGLLALWQRRSHFIYAAVLVLHWNVGPIGQGLRCDLGCRYCTGLGHGIAACCRSRFICAAV